MSGGEPGYKPPGRLKLLLMFLGDYLYGILLAFGWQPKEEREPGRNRPHP